MWDTDGDEVSGTFLRFSQGRTKDGTVVPIVVLDVEGQERSVWVFHEALRERFVSQVRARPSQNLDVGERITIRRGEKKQSQSNPDRSYRVFTVEFGNERTPDALAILTAPGPVVATQPAPYGEDIPF